MEVHLLYSLGLYSSATSTDQNTQCQVLVKNSYPIIYTYAHQLQLWASDGESVTCPWCYGGIEKEARRVPFKRTFNLVQIDTFWRLLSILLWSVSCLCTWFPNSQLPIGLCSEEYWTMGSTCWIPLLWIKISLNYL